MSTKPADPFRDHLVRLLDWEEAHVGFDKAVAGLPANQRGIRPPGFDHSAWELLEHMRIAQEDLLDFCANASYVHNRKWPDDYWPETPAPPSDQAWTASVGSYVRTREALKQLAGAVKDLGAKVPTGTKPTQTYARGILVVADHTAYHVGQLVAVRRALGVWQ